MLWVSNPPDKKYLPDKRIPLTTGSNRRFWLFNGYLDVKFPQDDFVQEQHVPALDAGPHKPRADAAKLIPDALMLVYYCQPYKYRRRVEGCDARLGPVRQWGRGGDKPLRGLIFPPPLGRV